MAWYRAGGGGIPSSLKTDMNAVLNKKFGTSTDYPPTDWAPSVNLLGPLPEKTASGAIAHITDGADTVPIKNWLVTLPASLDGYSSIVGTKAGKNLLDESLKKLNGRNIYYNAGINQNDCYSCVLPAGTYTFSVTTADGTITNLYARNYDTATNISGFPAYGVLKKTFTLTETTRVSFWIYKDTYTSLSDIVNAQVEVGSSNTVHADYTAPTVTTVSLGRTIYGGSADVVTGEGVDENGNDFTFTPITPTPDTELGVNNFWADTGDSEVTYRADIDLVLNALNGNRGLMMMRPVNTEEVEFEEEENR